jgi:hypothetical protein
MARLRGGWAAAVPMLAAGMLPVAAAAQGLPSREAFTCPAMLGTQPVPGGSSCFIEYSLHESPEAFRVDRVETLFCPAGDADCATRSRARSEAIRDSRFVVAEDGTGAEVLRLPVADAGLGGTGAGTTYETMTGSETRTVTEEARDFAFTQHRTRIGAEDITRTPIFDETFDLPFDDPVVQAAVAAAVALIESVPGMIALAPVRDAFATITQTEGATREVETGSRTTVTTQTVTGPGSYAIGTRIDTPPGTIAGDLGLCETPGAAGAFPTGCSNAAGGLEVVVPAGDAAVNVNRNIHRDILRLVGTTVTTTFAETWVVRAARALEPPVLPEGPLVERFETLCEGINPIEGSDPVFRPGARCFIESYERTYNAWNELAASRLVCPVDDLSCLDDPGPGALRQENVFSVIEIDGLEVLRYPNPPPSTTFSETTSRTETVTRESVLIREDGFETRITGRLEGAGQVFDITLNVPVTDPLGVAALNNATLAVTAAGGPGVVVQNAVLLERTETLQTSSTATEREVIGDPVESLWLQVTVGGVIDGVPINFEIGERTGLRSGDLGLCETPGGLNVPPTGWENSESRIIVPFGTTNNNVNQNFNTDIRETVTTTELWRIFEHWEVVGVLRALGEIHAALQSGARDLGQRLLRRMGDEAQAPQGFALSQPGVTVLSKGAPGVQAHGWVEGYALQGRVDATGGTAAETRRAGGIAAGLTWVELAPLV